MSNAYHVLHRLPFRSRDTTPPPLEMLAEQLVASGLLRINADDSRNFVAYNGTDFDLSFSRREMTDPKLLPETRQAIARTLPGAVGAQGVEDTYQRLLTVFRRTGDIPYEKELHIARLLVQAAHPSVIQLCLLQRVSIFVSYSHNVADLMAVHFWETHGTSGGLQSVSGDGTAVYVSCGGDPFIEKEEQKTYVTDGFPALSRLMVIAAQEFGHFADIARDAHGYPAGRYSAWLSPMRARDETRQARRGDQLRVAEWLRHVTALGIPELAKQEKRLAFFREKRRYSVTTLWQEWRVWSLRRRIRDMALRQDNEMLKHFPRALEHHPHWGMNILECLRDMAFNLAPDADAYRSDNPEEEEAILCIEALARVPQQSIKWSDSITRLCWPNLSHIYDNHVIPGCISAYEQLSGKRYYFPEVTSAARGNV